MLSSSICLQGLTVKDAYHATDVSFDVPLSVVTWNRSGGGFAARFINVTTLCWSYVSEECVAANSLESCITDQVGQILEAKAVAEQQQQHSHTASKTVAIAVPLAILGKWLHNSFSCLHASCGVVTIAKRSRLFTRQFACPTGNVRMPIVSHIVYRLKVQQISKYCLDRQVSSVMLCCQESCCCVMGVQGPHLLGH